jgi:phosphoribosylaminoimidazole (AIR) synthetase
MLDSQSADNPDWPGCATPMARVGRGKVWRRGDAAHDLAAHDLVIGLEGDGNHGNGRCLARQLFIKEREWPSFM